MSPTDDQRLVEAGAILSTAVAGDTVDTITARSYQHPGLGDRRVVQLVPQSLGAAEDLALEFLGFVPAAEPETVGTGRRQALGFPAWALINDPANGHHALALVKDLERLARQAKTKPGAAKDGFDVLARRLDRAVPHFLPTFFEQAGRSFLAADSPAVAAQMFGRARQAERVHALAIDEERQRDVFLEFAFAGALSAKALGEHARDLAVRADPEDAYALFLRLCLERVAGGLPPYAAMAKDLRRLAKAADLDAAAQDTAVIRAVLDLPAVARAPLAFWKDYRATLVDLGGKDVAVRERLLDLFPATDQVGTEDFWFDLLDGCGATVGLTQVDDDPMVARPRGGAAAWLERAVTWRARGWRSMQRSERFLTLVAAMADRLRAENRPLQPFPGGGPWYQIDLDLLDLCLALGLDLEFPEDLKHLPFDRWLQDDRPGRRDLAALAAREPVHRLLVADLGQLVRRNSGRATTPGSAAAPAPAYLTVLVEQAGARSVLATWLRDRAETLTTGALPGLTDALTLLAVVAYPAVLAVEPTLAERLAQADPGRALARTLRLGIIDELGWPALEETIGQFPETSGRNTWERQVRTCGAWPGLILVDKAKAVVVGSDGEVARHDIREFPGHARSDRNVTVAAYVDGQFLITWSAYTGTAGYWSNRPDDVFDVPWDAVRSGSESFLDSLPLPGGGRTTGGRPVTVGDRRFAEPRQIVSDGPSWYRTEGESWRGNLLWREYDPATGDGGRECLPAFFEAGLDGEGTELVPHLCSLVPVPPGFEHSPLGVRDGLLGWRTVQGPGGTTGTGIDGTTVTVTPAQREALVDGPPVGVLRLPAGGSVTLLQRGDHLALTDGSVVGSTLVLGTRVGAYSAGTPYLPPFPWWHALRPRDEAGSAALRALPDDRGRALLDAGPDQVGATLPELSHPGLIAGVAGIVELAVTCRQQAEELLAAVTAGSSTAPTGPELGDIEFAAAVAGLTSENGWAPLSGYYHDRSRRSATTVPALTWAVDAAWSASGSAPVSGAAAVGRTDRTCSVGGTDWTCAVGGLGALALRAVSEATPAPVREALVTFLEAVADTPLAAADGQWRVATLVAREESEDEDDGPSGLLGRLIRVEDGTAVVVGASTRWDSAIRGHRTVALVLQHAQAGRFGAVPGFTVESARVHTGWGGAESIRELVDLVRTRGPVPWRPEAVTRLAAETGLTRAEAALLLAGLPGIDAWDRNFLDPQTREVLGLKVAEAAAVKPGLARIPGPTRLAVCAAAVPPRAADLWDTGPDVEAMARAWIDAFGRRVVVPEELLAQAPKPLTSRDLTATELLAGLLGPRTCRWLTTDGRFVVRDGELVNDGAAEALTGRLLTSAVAGLAWLTYELALDHPLRPELPRAAEELRARAANRDLLVLVLEQVDVSGLRRSFGHPGRTSEDSDVEELALGDAGILVDRGWGQYLYLRPAALTGPEDPLLTFGRELYDPPLAALRLLVGGGLERLVSPTATVPGWAQNPLVSVPELVAEVRDRYALAESAAQLYLQVLALPDPTDARVARWNGWTTSRVRTTAASLVAAGLLVEGKRSRAGRTAFVPGGWLDVKAPMLPIETWKVPLLGYTPAGQGSLGLSVPAVPVADLFVAAWRRVLDDDGPALETLRTGRRR